MKETPSGSTFSVSVLICTRNRAEALRETLGSVAGVRVPEGSTAELIVVDNGSTDGTARLVRSTRLPNLPVRLVHEPCPGLSHARNAGLRAAAGDILLFTDDDVRLPPDWIAGMCRPIREGGADAVAGRVVLAEPLQRPWMQPVHRIALASTEYLREERPGVFFGASMGFARRVLDRVPGFDPALGAGRLGAGEETLFAWQLLEAGFTLTTAFDVPVVHVPDTDRLTRTAYLASAEKIGRSYAYIDYHWLHRPAGHWRHSGVPSVRLTLALYRVRLATLRLRHRRACRTPEGIPPWEYTLVKRIAGIRHYLHEYKHPRCYDRRSLTKRPAAPCDLFEIPE